MQVSAVHPRNENSGLYNINAVVSKDYYILIHLFLVFSIIGYTLSSNSQCANMYNTIKVKLCVAYKMKYIIM